MSHLSQLIYSFVIVQWKISINKPFQIHLFVYRLTSYRFG
ncbi:hypothetical protein F383_16096 [Gossypium arboreum]|uniref:Uncharacterized protein n=1 Tax=Gossypium arboreum TaxID=29729 RepID=A0A0B0N7T2_GOSAR|nr:hypothetical protein F383_16096 [Gossypium arboreum]